MTATNKATPDFPYAPSATSPSDGNGGDALTKTQSVSLLWPLAGLLAAAFCLYFFGLGSVPLFDVDEPRYAEAAREMIERGDWITPYFNYEIRLQKPVFFYWLVAFSYQLLGVNEFAARLPSALMALTTVLSVAAFARKSVNTRFAVFTGLILLTSAQMIGLSRMSITDMTLSAFIVLTVLCLYQVAHRDTRWWLAAGLFSGLAILTKGPVGMVLPGAVLVFYSLVSGRFKQAFLNRWFPLGIVTALAVALPWYWLAYLENGQFFLDSLVFNNVDRFTSVVTGHSQERFLLSIGGVPVLNYFYLVVLLVGFLPWSVFLPSVVLQGRQLVGNLAQLRTPHAPADTDARLRQVFLFSAVWAGFIFLFFSLSHTKLLTYILPLFPALALMSAVVLYRSEQSPGFYARVRPWLLGGAALLLLAGLVLSFFLLTQMAAILPKEAVAIATNQYNLLAAGILVAGLSVFATFIWRRQLMAAVVAATTMLSVIAVVAMTGILPNVSAVLQGPMHHFTRLADGNPLVTYEITRPSLTFYTRNKVHHIARDDDAKLNRLIHNEQFMHRKPLYIITKNRYVEQFQTLIVPNLTDVGPVTLVEQGPVYSLMTLQ